MSTLDSALDTMLRGRQTHLPVVEHALWECLTAGVGPEVRGEAEALVDRQVCLHVEHRGTHNL